MAAYKISTTLIAKRVRKEVQKMLLSNITVSLIEGGHSKLYQTLQFSSVYHHTKFPNLQ